MVTFSPSLNGGLALLGVVLTMFVALTIYAFTIMIEWHFKWVRLNHAVKYYNKRYGARTVNGAFFNALNGYGGGADVIDNIESLQDDNFRIQNDQKV